MTGDLTRLGGVSALPGDTPQQAAGASDGSGVSPVDQTEQHAREAAHNLLRRALESGQPLGREVGAALYQVLSMLRLSEQPPWLEVGPDATYEEQVENGRWHAAGWRGAVEQYRELLAVVRENGALS